MTVDDNLLHQGSRERAAEAAQPHPARPAACGTAEPAGERDRVRLALTLALSYEVGANGADFVFCFHPARTACQSVTEERLMISQSVVPRLQRDAKTDTRYLRLRARPGPLTLHYRATVDIAHRFQDPAGLPEVPVDALPLEVIPYIFPSRYCESDRFLQMAFSLFGHLQPGHGRVLAIQAWVREQVRFASNSSNSATSAVDTLASGRGVCRDFAHLMIALCRALSIPARFTTGTDYGADPALGPPDFHAYVEVYLGDRWYTFDPSRTAIPMGMMRIATGRDAADVAFATMFGNVIAMPPVINAVAIEDRAQRLVLPVHCESALSSDGTAYGG